MTSEYRVARCGAYRVAILHQLDTRLSRLDKSIGKLGIREITRQSSNLDAALEILTGTRPAPTALSHKASYGGSSVNSHAGVNGTSSRAGSKAGSRAASSSGHQRGLSSSHTFGNLAAEAPAKDPTTPPVPSISVMERGRAIPRPDVVPRWATETPTPSSTNSSTTRTRVTSPQTNTAATTPQQPAWTPNAASDLPSPGGARAIVSRGPDIMSIGEYFGALEVLIADLEHMNQGLVEGRGGTREQGVAELVSDALMSGSLTSSLGSSSMGTVARCSSCSSLCETRFPGHSTRRRWPTRRLHQRRRGTPSSQPSSHYQHGSSASSTPTPPRRWTCYSPSSTTASPTLRPFEETGSADRCRLFRRASMRSMVVARGKAEAARRSSWS